MKLLNKGAEAELFLTSFFGQNALLKKRTKKGYRAKELDEKIISQRTKQEALLLSRAKSAGVRTPFVFYANKKTGEILMEFVDAGKAKKLKAKTFLDACFLIGKDAALLHKAGIIHGDLTTANILVKGKELVFVDFGLGFFSGKTEDKAVDLLVLKKSLKAVHFDEPEAFEKVLKGYAQNTPNASQVTERISEIEKRTRYS